MLLCFFRLLRATIRAHTTAEIPATPTPTPMPTPAPVEIPPPCSDVEERVLEWLSEGVAVLSAVVVVLVMSALEPILVVVVKGIAVVVDSVFVEVNIEEEAVWVCAATADDFVEELSAGGSWSLMLKYADETCLNAVLPWLSAVPLNSQKKKTFDFSRSKSYNWTRQLKESLTSGRMVPVK